MGDHVIATFESSQARAVQESGLPAVEFLIRQNWASTELPPWSDLRSGKTLGEIDAAVNHGRWVVECPQEGCSGAQLASESDHRFVCVECASGPYKVVWPRQREAIEEAMRERPTPNRNWVPGESVGDLRSENKKRGR